MKIHENCLPCIVNQTIKSAQMTDRIHREALYRAAFEQLSKVDFSQTAPEMCGSIFRIVREKLGVWDPYAEIRHRCNGLMLRMKPELEKMLASAEDPFLRAVEYAILGNIIDFSANTKLTEEGILETFQSPERFSLTIDDTPRLKEACCKAKHLLYVGDNCGEIVADALLLEQIHRLNPEVQCTYAVRAKPVVNDVIASDAEECGIPKLASVIDTGDDSQGLVLSRAGEELRSCYAQADVIIAKGQGNMEGLTEQGDERVFCLLMAKCAHIADYLGIRQGSLVVLQLH